MRTSGLLLSLAVGLCGLAPPAAAQEKPLPPPDRAPHLVLAHDGLHAPVTALAFSPDASTLYVGGFDKQVRRYKLANGKYEPAGAFRVPIGPGNAGVVNAVAVSPDGKWVAVAGRAPIREEGGGGADDGIGEDVRHYPPLLRRDAGVVYLFDPAKPDGGKVIRGQQSEVRALAFANPAPAAGPVLVTAGIEWDEKGRYAGTVRVFDATTGAEIAARKDFPATKIPPGLAAWATGAEERRAARRGGVGRVRRRGGQTAPQPAAHLGQPQAERRHRQLGGGSAVDLPARRSRREGRHRDRTAQRRVRPDPEQRRGERAPRDRRRTQDRLAQRRGRAVTAAHRTRRAHRRRRRRRDGGAAAGGRGADGRQYELRLVTPKGQPGVTLTGFHPQQPVLSASPDGRFLAVAGFKDNRVEVYDAAKFAAGKPARSGELAVVGGYGKVAFLIGEKLWLGGATETPETGGVVLDLDRAVRAVVPRPKDAPKVDAPATAARRNCWNRTRRRSCRRVSWSWWAAWRR